jgi:hypothetical protein
MNYPAKRAIVEKELKGLENLDLKNRLDANFCDPGIPNKSTPQIRDVLNGVQQLQRSTWHDFTDSSKSRTMEL